jgi:hypothetical protein
MNYNVTGIFKQWTLPNLLIVIVANIVTMCLCPNMEKETIATISLISSLYLAVSTALVYTVLKMTKNNQVQKLHTANAPISIPEIKVASAICKSNKNDILIEELTATPFLTMEDYNRALDKHQKSKEKLQEDIYTAIDTHIKVMIAPVVGADAANTLCANYRGFDINRSYALLEVNTMAELDSTSIFHLAWNIGKRLKWNGSQITQFAKHSFPHQLRDASEEYIKCNLTRNPLEGIFKLDRPEKGCYEFNYAL